MQLLVGVFFLLLKHCLETMERASLGSILLFRLVPLIQLTIVEKLNLENYSVFLKNKRNRINSTLADWLVRKDTKGYRKYFLLDRSGI